MGVARLTARCFPLKNVGYQDRRRELMGAGGCRGAAMHVPEEEVVLQVEMK